MSRWKARTKHYPRYVCRCGKAIPFEQIEAGETLCPQCKGSNIQWERRAYGDVWRASTGEHILFATQGFAEIMRSDGQTVWQQGCATVAGAKALCEQEYKRITEERSP